ncbi:hypothetical protein JCM9140_1677 [Halalkalibacter wakoensis JCM 9140]|uniref:Uncharacterized protein n=1 Tax=Halalkalibacter wakoensis JCM 9140 TaxID=1236970 RepID=W4Q142_9BACI|nr:hypothetical protein JCM9140_1677 [Halalkalibacter wakoensis JCM 9140]
MLDFISITGVVPKSQNGPFGTTSSIKCKEVFFHFAFHDKIHIIAVFGGGNQNGKRSARISC